MVAGGEKISKKVMPEPLRELFVALGRPWSLHILWILSAEGPQRFGVLRRAIGNISARVLTERLRGLENEGIVYRHYKQTIPPEVTYGLTKPFEEIGTSLKALDRLSRRQRG
jgi:DNA-binding HxlR family transcriptional regulator